LKNKLNLLLLISFLIAVFLTIWLFNQITSSVGDIAFNKELDKSTFKVCDEKRINQYYSVKSNYQNGKRGLKKDLWNSIESLTFKNSGYITFRFVINCNGETGRFRVKTVDSELKINYFNAEKIKTLQSFIENLEKWDVKKWNDRTFDSYFHLTFKVNNGKITDVF